MLEAKMFKDKVVVITGAAQGIGKCIKDEFLKCGANVCVIDLKDNSYFVGDLSKKKDIEAFVLQTFYLSSTL